VWGGGVGVLYFNNQKEVFVLFSITGQRLSEESKGIAERWFVISITEALHHTKSFMSNYDQ
jgi:hypothetical protein